jgi:hypothetical protein
MKFEKISDKKFAAFKQSEVVNPIMISGGWIETSNPGTSHDRYENSHSNGQTTMDNYTSCNNGFSYTMDGTTES